MGTLEIIINKITLELKNKFHFTNFMKSVNLF